MIAYFGQVRAGWINGLRQFFCAHRFGDACGHVQPCDTWNRYLVHQECSKCGLHVYAACDVRLPEEISDETKSRVRGVVLSETSRRSVGWWRFA